MDVDLISKETEALLVRSLRDSIADVNGGTPPNEALSKRAIANGLGPELTCRLVEAYNTSKTLNVLRNTQGEKRAESFELADRDTVVSALYAKPEKTASVSVPYSDPRRVNFNTAPTSGVQKAASAGRTVLTKRSSSQFIGRPERVIQDARGVLAGIKHSRDEVRMLRKQAFSKVATSLEDFVNAFKRADRSSLSPLKDVEERLSYHFGPIAKQAVDLAYAQLPKKIQEREKRSSAVPTSYVYPLTDALYKLGEQLITALDEAGTLHAQSIEFEKKASVVEQALGERLALITGRTEPVAKKIEPVSKQADFDPQDAYEAGAAGGAAGEGGDKGKGGGSVSDIFNIPQAKPLRVTSLYPSEHEGRLRAIKAKLMLNEMITSDPVISGYPVEHVVTAYNRAAELVPSLSTQPIAMRGIIASMLQREGGLESLELKTLLDTEERSRRLRVLGD